MPFGVNPTTGRPGPAPKPPRDDDREQARQRINVDVKAGRRPHPNTLPCAACGHVWREGERRHEYHHHLGYAAEHHADVQPLCTTCHAATDSTQKAKTHCLRGHEYTPQNTINKPNGCRQCRECCRIKDRRRGWRRGAARNGA